MVIVIGSAILNVAWLLPIYPDAAQAIATANCLIAAVAALGYVLIRTVARYQPEAIVIGMLITLDLGTAALRLTHAPLFLVTAGYLVLLPPAVALVMPWAITMHVGWLFGHILAVLAMASIAPNPAAPPLGLAGLLVVSSAVSLLGQLAGLRARVGSFVQVQRIRALRRAADRDRARLDRLNRLLERSALTDELTGLGNRLRLNLELEALRSRVERRAERHAILLIDVDRFKAINDAIGHLAGDEVLRRVAQVLESATRLGDSAYRFGGEEFVVVARLNGTTEALGVAERIRRAVAELAIPHAGNPPHGFVTVSVGVAAFEANEIDERASLARADKALYDAKAAGRNTSIIAADG